MGGIANSLIRMRTSRENDFDNVIETLRQRLQGNDRALDILKNFETPYKKIPGAKHRVGTGLTLREDFYSASFVHHFKAEHIEQALSLTEADQQIEAAEDVLDKSHRSC